MKITISGPAVACDSELNTEIVAPQILRQYHGIKSEESCVTYFDDPLGEIGLIGGQLETVFDEVSQRLRIRTVYHSPRTLTKKELSLLVEDTRGQWSDGIGENGFETGDENICLDLCPIGFDIDTDDVTVEQVDDGVKVAKPRKSPLFAAAKKNDVAKIAKLLDAGEPVDPRDRLGNTPLLEAIDGNHLDAVRLLVERGADVNASDRIPFTALVNASTAGYLEILEILLKAGANPNYGGPDTIENNQYYPIHMACNRRQPGAVRLLVEYGAEVNIACRSGYTALMHLQEDDIDVARFLVEHGADINAENVLGKGMKTKLKQAVS